MTRYQVIFNQDGWAVLDSHRGVLTDTMLKSAGEAYQVAARLEQHDQRVEASISRWQATGTA